jgi:predicted ATPase
MIESVQFKNFKGLRDATLPLSRFTLIVGPNGSGKSTALQALQALRNPESLDFRSIVTAGVQLTKKTTVEVVLDWGEPYKGIVTTVSWSTGGVSAPPDITSQAEPQQRNEQYLRKVLSGIRVYSLNANAISAPVPLEPNMHLSESGGNLAGVLDRLRDQVPERFEAINEQLGFWLPEFDRILFDTPDTGQRAILLRTREGHHKIPAKDLSQGTLLALTMLTLSYLPDPPSMVCLEEPDRGIHPRLLRHVQDALYGLSHPDSRGEKRDPIQVVATTHSPYFLDLYKDHPEEIVIANRIGQDVRFERLSDRPDIEEILGDAPLGDIWYTGILGGVPCHP